MKKAIIALSLVLAASGAVGAQAQTAASMREQKKEAVKKYACPMHPDEVSDKPGKCSKCGMKLELVKGSKSKG